MVLATTRRCELTRAADTPIGAGFHNVKRLRHGVSANRSGGRPGVWQKDARLKHVILFSPYPDAGEIYCDCRQNRQRHDKTSYFIHLSAVRHTAESPAPFGALTRSSPLRGQPINYCPRSCREIFNWKWPDHQHIYVYISIQNSSGNSQKYINLARRVVNLNIPHVRAHAGFSDPCFNRTRRVRPNFWFN